jgi:flagellar biogenesis protein FliO
MTALSLGAAAASLASLLAILLLLAAVALALRRVRARLNTNASNLQGNISIIANKPLGGQHMLIIAEAQGQRFLIGVSRDGMDCLGTLNRHD